MTRLAQLLAFVAVLLLLWSIDSKLETLVEYERAQTLLLLDQSLRQPVSPGARLQMILARDLAQQLARGTERRHFLTTADTLTQAGQP